MLGKKVADFSAAATGGEFKLSAHKGDPVVIYFYPRDNTPGCTTEGMQFRDLHRQFVKAGAVVVGVSRDIKMKNMYGKKVRGIERSTFVIDSSGKLAREWRGVKVPGHAQEVLDVVKTL